MITVFTPTYNRANLILRLYQSLKEQTYKDFEWLIVDDGSTDNTSQIINEIINSENCFFSIRYFKVNNGGKHRAINYGVSKAKGQAFFIVDSDDWLPQNALKDVWYYFNEIKDDVNFAGVAGLKTSIIPNPKEKTFDGEYLDATSLERKKYGIFGEKAEVFKTAILKQYPFPEFINENFITEAVVWDKIAYDGFKLRWFNTNVYTYEYQEDGLSNNLFKKYRENPIGYLTYLKQEMSFGNVSILKKYMFFGRALNIVKDSSLNKKEARKLLGINALQSVFSKCIYFIYKLKR